MTRAICGRGRGPSCPTFHVAHSTRSAAGGAERERDSCAAVPLLGTRSRGGGVVVVAAAARSSDHTSAECTAWSGREPEMQM
jgi:hypothetical protein